jgi:hypothetical protein
MAEGSPSVVVACDAGGIKKTVITMQAREIKRGGIMQNPKEKWFGARAGPCPDGAAITLGA